MLHNFMFQINNDIHWLKLTIFVYQGLQSESYDVIETGFLWCLRECKTLTNQSFYCKFA